MAYRLYDKPPPIYDQSQSNYNRPPPVVPRHSGASAPPAYSHNDKSLNGSWSTNESYIDATRGIMGPRRESWVNLVASQNNLHSTNAVSIDPSGSKPTKDDKKSKKKKKMPMLTVSDEGLFKSAFSNPGREPGSKEGSISTGSEFILVPNSYPSSAAVSSVGPRVNRRCIFSSKTCIVLLALLFFVLGAAAVIAVLSRTSQWPMVYQFTSSPRDNNNAQNEGESAEHVINVVLSRNQRGTFTVVGGKPFANIKTTIDFDKRHSYTYDGKFDMYCIFEQLNEANLPPIEEVAEAAKNSVKYPPMTNDWLQDWHWDLEQVKDDDNHHWNLCPGDRRLQLIQTKESNFAKPCPGCSQVCLPNYDIKSEDAAFEGRRLAIISYRCVWMYIPEWSDYQIPGFGNEIAQSGTDIKYDENYSKFEQYYKLGLHRTALKLTANKSNQPWVKLNTPRPNPGILDQQNSIDTTCFDPIRKVYEACPILNNSLLGSSNLNANSGSNNANFGSQSSQQNSNNFVKPKGKGWVNVNLPREENSDVNVFNNGR